MNKLNIVLILSIICVPLSLSLCAKDSGHFWRPSNIWDLPRFEQPLLQTFNLYLSEGSATRGRNSNGWQVPLFDIYGPQSLQFLGANFPGLNPENPIDQLLLTMAELPARNGFGYVSFSGRFDLIESYLDYFQNIDKGFFVWLNIPIRSFNVMRLQYNDYSLLNTENAYNPLWIKLLHSLDSIFARYNIHYSSYHYVDLGDTTVALGWTHTFNPTRTLDYVDTMVTVGGLFPTGRRTSLYRPFEIPTGYDGHFGITTTFDCTIGLFDWLTFGAHLENIAFFDTTCQWRVKTAPEQNGFIKLATATVSKHAGPLWIGGLVLKADHFVQGISFGLSYSYEHKGPTRLYACDTNFPIAYSVLNSDSALAGFTQHVLTVNFEYDFMSACGTNAPRAGFFYNHSIGGRRIFITPVIGLSAGIDIVWDF